MRKLKVSTLVSLDGVMQDPGGFGEIQSGEYATMLNELPTLVASTSLTEPLEWNATLLKGDVTEKVAALKQESGKDILMYGSAGLMHTLMRDNLIDEYQLWVHPVVLGNGKRLFADGAGVSSLRLVGTETLGSGVVILTDNPIT